MYLDGASIMRIKSVLEQRGFPAPSGGTSWPKRTIEKILCNEKYSGSVLLYKTYTAEYPATGQIVNEGQHEKLLAEDHHPAIIGKEIFDQVQEELARRRQPKGELKW